MSTPTRLAAGQVLQGPLFSEPMRVETVHIEQQPHGSKGQAGGGTYALRALLKAEQEWGPDFVRLANAPSALYPRQSEEKRLLDAMLLALPGR